MWALVVTVLLCGSEHPVPPEPPPRLYEPWPWAEWCREVDLKEVAPVVVVASRRKDGEPPTLFGNGVVIDSRDASSWILTCAHLVRPAFEAEIRVGVFRHSFVGDSRERLDYQEIEARLVHADGGSDLAVLEIPGGGLRAAAISRESGTLLPRRVISIVPFGRPTLIRGWHPFLRPGQSGSPDLDEGVVCAMARGMGGFQGQARYGLESFVEAGEIQAFLAALEFPVNFCDPSV
jgi:hypothetical protein